MAAAAACFKWVDLLEGQFDKVGLYISLKYHPVLWIPNDFSDPDPIFSWFQIRILFRVLQEFFLIFLTENLPLHPSCKCDRQCGGSGMFIPDPKTATKDRGEKFFFSQTIFCSHKVHKTEYYFIFDMLKKKIWPHFPRIIEVFTQKLVTKP
jgi:hypothetical protein